VISHPEKAPYVAILLVVWARVEIIVKDSRVGRRERLVFKGLEVDEEQLARLLVPAAATEPSRSYLHGSQDATVALARS
jgi:hypothetical protein